MQPASPRSHASGAVLVVRAAALPGRVAAALARPVGALAVLAVVAVACDGGAVATPPITPGTSVAPREVNIVARDYGYVPAPVDLVPGETVLLHVVNGGLAVHEAILGDLDTQLAWEAAEAPFLDPPPGPTPTVTGPAGFDGVRVVAGSGQRVDVTWTVPADAGSAAGGWFVGCHIPGHWDKGMVVPVRFVDRSGSPLGAADPRPAGDLARLAGKR
jgi:uncharacterized cupredoxin-like copper-binding protein